MLHSSRMQVESALFFESPVEVFFRVYRQLQPDAAVPRMDLEFRPFSNANSRIRRLDQVLEIRITDLLEGAPAPILEALAHILLAKMLRRRVPTAAQQIYRRYMNQPDVQSKVNEIRVARGRKQQRPPAGRHFHLERMFELLNERYFETKLRRPQLGWSQRQSRTRLGHYDPSHYSITLSSLLDRPDVPPLVVEYVLFHEMLHIAHPATHQGATRSIHTLEFRRAERAYPYYREARRHLQQMLAQPD